MGRCISFDKFEAPRRMLLIILDILAVIFEL
jgi:hypothetical protein